MHIIVEIYNADKFSFFLHAIVFTSCLLFLGWCFRNLIQTLIENNKGGEYE